MYQCAEGAYDYANMYSPDNIPATCFKELLDNKSMEVMQFTGLKDKNGKDIYEGDILQDGKKQNGKVLWHRNSYLVEWEERGYDGHLLQDRMYDDCFGYGEIIGNIYSTPTLLPPPN